MEVFEIETGLVAISDGRWKAQQSPDINHNRNSPYNFGAEILVNEEKRTRKRREKRKNKSK
jgi:hypothetical protein